MRTARWTVREPVRCRRFTGNLVDDPGLRFTPIPREFAISEVLVGLNRRVDRRG
jgi:hypothetical protein